MGALTRQSFEREFLIRLAPNWMRCRLQVMGHPISHWKYGNDLGYAILGMVDYANEMKLLCQEQHSALVIQSETESDCQCRVTSCPPLDRA